MLLENTTVKVQRLVLAVPSARTQIWPSTCQVTLCYCDSPVGRAGGLSRAPFLEPDRLVWVLLTFRVGWPRWSLDLLDFFFSPNLLGEF